MPSAHPANSPSVHRVFSPARIFAIAGNTFLELTRLKVFYFVLLFTLLLFGASIFLARLTFQQEFQVLKDISLGAMSIFTTLLAILATARLLPQEIEDRTIYTVLAKPVPRFEYLTGKLLGVIALLLVGTLAMTALAAGTIYLHEQAAIADAQRQIGSLPNEQIADSIRQIRQSAFNAGLAQGIAAIFLQSCLLASLTLFISTIATSGIFTIVVAVFIYFIGNLQATAREYWLQEQGTGWISRTFLGLIALLFPDLQLFNLADQVVIGAAVPHALFLKIVLMGGFYTLFYLLLAAAVFAAREL